MIDDIAKMRSAGFHKLRTYLEWHEADVFAYKEEMYEIIFSSCFFNEILVAEGEGICIHDDCSAALAFLREGAFGCKSSEVIRKALPAVFHKTELAGHAGNLIKTKVTKEFCTLAFRIEEELQVATAVLQLNQMGENRI